MAGGSDDALRPHDFSVVPTLGYAVSVHATLNAAGGLDREFACGLLAASGLGYPGG